MALKCVTLTHHLGRTFVSTEEGVSRSMSQKKTYPICGHDNGSKAGICFNLEANTLVIPEYDDTEHTKRIREELPASNYSLIRRW